MPKTPPVYLLAGGRGAIRLRGPDPLLREALCRAALRKPRVAYVGAASGDNAAFRLLIGRMLKKAGAGEVVLAPLCGRRADPWKAQAVLSAADLVFVSGGDVYEGIRVLNRHGMIPFLRCLHGEGTAFVGVSAGSIMLASTWIRWADPDNDKSAELFPCLNLARVLCDTHGEADGWEELRAMLARSPLGTTGYGIVAGSGLVAASDGAVSALGGEVHVFSNRPSGVVQVKSLLPSGVP